MKSFHSKSIQLPPKAKLRKTDAGNGSHTICHVINALSENEG